MCWQHTQHERLATVATLLHWPRAVLVTSGFAGLLAMYNDTFLQKWAGGGVLRVQWHNFNSRTIFLQSLALTPLLVC